MPNACAVGPDGLLYFPEVLSGDIWRMPLDGGQRERFIGGMATPPAVKFDNRGALMVLESHTGDVTRIDLQSRRKTRVATIETGLDNFVIAPDDRIFVSSFAHGSVGDCVEWRATRARPTGLIGPWGLTCSGDNLLIADGPSLMRPRADGAAERVAWVGDKGFPASSATYAPAPTGCSTSPRR